MMSKLKHENVVCVENILFMLLAIPMEYWNTAVKSSIYGQYAQVFSLDKYLQLVKISNFNLLSTLYTCCTRHHTGNGFITPTKALFIVVSSRQLY